MSDLKINPLATASVEDLVEELASRFPRGLIVGGARESSSGSGYEHTYLDYRNGLMSCLGLAETLRVLIGAEMLDPTDDIKPRET